MKHNECCVPVYEEIMVYDTEYLIRLFSSKQDLMVLSSAMITKDHGQYTFICFDAFASFIAKNNTYFWNNRRIAIDNPFNFINEKINLYKITKHDNLPPLQGGIVGYFGYEASHYLEVLPQLKDPIQLPDIYLNFYSSIIVIDHLLNQSWIIATGFPEMNNNARVMLAKTTITQIKQTIKDNSTQLNSQYLTKKMFGTLVSNFTQDSYVEAVLNAKKYILNGDIFEANISQRFKIPILDKTISILELYFKLMTENPAPYSAFIKFPNNNYIISASPERFIKLVNQSVETCPIKGTKKRSKNNDEDKKLAEELMLSQKDRAENIMIVDLMRNDLSRVCQPGSIKVNELCYLKSFATVHHLVSKITGQLKTGKNAIDLIKATFPPGSVTGAPKIRAMEIISELEQETRGPYCGTIGYVSFTGDMDSSVVIRTYCINNKKIFFSTGGAIVLDSDPEEEYYESITKAQALIEVLIV